MMYQIVLSTLLFIINELIIGSDPFKGEQCIVKSEFIFQSGDVSFPSCHASTIIETGSGLLTAWFGGFIWKLLQIMDLHGSVPLP
jgi:ABC-type sulfate transport system permease component